MRPARQQLVEFEAFYLASFLNLCIRESLDRLYRKKRIMLALSSTFLAGTSHVAEVVRVYARTGCVFSLSADTGDLSRTGRLL
jgi:hypothetical protein